MASYTIEAFKFLIQTAKKVNFWFSVSIQVLILGYFTYTLIVPSGNPLINALLLSVSFVSFVYFLYTEIKPGKENNEDTIKSIISVFSLLIKLFNLGFILYGFYTATESVSPLAIVVTVFMIILWVIQVIIEIVTLLILYIKYFIWAAWEADKNAVSEPFTKTENFVRRLLGKEEKDIPKPSTVQKKLQKRIDNRKKKSKT